MDKTNLQVLFDEFLLAQIDLFKETKTGDEWIQERKAAYDLYRDKFHPHKINQLTAKEFETFLTMKGNKSWTNLPRSCKCLTQDMDKLRKVLVYLQNESLPVTTRLNEVTVGGKLYMKGFGKNIATGILHVINWQKYGVWNNRSQRASEQLNLLPELSLNFGESYVRINDTLDLLAQQLKTDLVYVDGFLYWLDENNKFLSNAPQKKFTRKGKKNLCEHIPSIQELEKAKKTFEKYEPRDLFYRTAKELVDLAIRKETSLTVAEALAVLLQTWNMAYYRYRAFDSKHFSDIENIINTHFNSLLDLRQRSLESFSDKDEALIKNIFNSFEVILGPVGAAKSLHLLAPRFFPLWDRAIASAYKVMLLQSGKNADNYCAFMKVTKDQCTKFGGEKTLRRNPLKALDEYNYCKFTKKWI